MYCSEPSFSRTVTLRYLMHLESGNLAPGTINLRLGAVRRLTYEAAGSESAGATGSRRNRPAVRGKRGPNDTLKGQRDRALSAVLPACGLRRHEAVSLETRGLRRSRARLCHAAGGEMEQIQFPPGHVSIQTTVRYLGCKYRIRSAVNDRTGH